MKFCALLLIVAAVCVMLPSEAEARPGSRRLSVRHLLSRAPLEVAKRRPGRSGRHAEAPLAVAKRRPGNWRRGRQLSSQDSEEIAAYLNSDEVAALLTRFQLTREEFDDAIDNDPEIEEEDRPIVKALALMVLSSLEADGLWPDDSSEEDK